MYEPVFFMMSGDVERMNSFKKNSTFEVAGYLSKPFDSPMDLAPVLQACVRVRSNSLNENLTSASSDSLKF